MASAAVCLCEISPPEVNTRLDVITCGRCGGAVMKGITPWLGLVPPPEVSLTWCPSCGRDDRHVPFQGHGHYHRGKRCDGTPVDVTYARTGEWPDG